METVEHKGHKIKIFSGIEDLSIKRYNLFNMLLLRDSGVGSTFKDIMIRLANLDKHLENENIESARIERRNLQLTLYSSLYEINFKQMAFVCLIYSIDGEKTDDLSEEGILETRNRLEEIELSQKILWQLNEKKKKIL